jgi:enamine deaminase RidA (YjgF/YER057c/UK114 family)
MPITRRLKEADGLAPGNGFVHAVAATGQLAFVSGQVATNAEGGVVGAGDLAAQTTQALLNLQTVIRALGADWTDVVRLNWYVLDVAELQALRDARDEILRPVLGDLPNPASSLIRVAGLFRPEFLVEIDAVVALPR